MCATQHDLLHLVLLDFLKDLADFVLVALRALILPTIEGDLAKFAPEIEHF
jgi:hypothetical protein